MSYFIVALIAFTLGFVVGLKSKIQPKIKSKNKKIGNVYIKDVNNLPVYKNAPPPPPLPRKIKEGKNPPEPQSLHNKNAL